MKSNSNRGWTYDVQIDFTECKVTCETLQTNCCCKDKHDVTKNKSQFCWHIILCLNECIDSNVTDNTQIVNSVNKQEIPDSPMEPEYVVERILAQRTTNGIKEYLVKWAGYKVTTATWESQENLRNAPECLKYYFGLLNNSKIDYVKREEAN